MIKVAPISSIVQELVRFDLQQLENPEISGLEYQQGVLCGYEIREYLLNKWDRKCAYCGVTDTPLQVEHIHPKAQGGSNRISNLCLACDVCNKKKGTQGVEQFRLFVRPRSPGFDGVAARGIGKNTKKYKKIQKKRELPK